MKASFTHANPKNQKGFKQPKFGKGKNPQFDGKRAEQLTLKSPKKAADLKALLNK